MSAVGLQNPRDTASDFAALQFVVEQMLHRMQTAMPVRVMAVTNDGGVAAVGRVDVLPLVKQITGDGVTTPHATIFNVPYCRWQGGTDAVILDPKVGDIGLCVFASRDISSVKADPQAAAASGGATPGSARTYNYADGVYVGGILNGVPEQFVQFYAEGIRVVSPTKVRVEAPVGEVVASERITLQAPTIELKGDVAQSEGDITATGKYTGEQDVVGDGISLHDHVHGGVQSGGSSTDPPS